MENKVARRGFTQKAVYKNSHSRESLSGIYNASDCQTKQKTLLNGCVEDSQLRPLGMTTLLTSGQDLTYKNCSAFTLIELLVVVLIIGILAAVAVPQYKIAVVKSRVASILPIVATLQKAEAAYYLANGDHTFLIQELDVDVPCIEVLEIDTGNPFWKCGNDFLVQVSETGAYASYCPTHNDSVEGCKENRDLQIAFNHLYTSSKGSRHCLVRNDSSLGEAVCKTLGKKKLSTGDYLMK